MTIKQAETEIARLRAEFYSQPQIRREQRRLDFIEVASLIGCFLVFVIFLPALFIFLGLGGFLFFAIDCAFCLILFYYIVDFYTKGLQKIEEQFKALHI